VLLVVDDVTVCVVEVNVMVDVVEELDVVLETVFVVDVFVIDVVVPVVVVVVYVTVVVGEVVIVVVSDDVGDVVVVGVVVIVVVTDDVGDVVGVVISHPRKLPSTYESIAELSNARVDSQSPLSMMKFAKQSSFPTACTSGPLNSVITLLSAAAVCVHD
jgi:Flp pilus assembly CpaF family ATPase